MVNTILNLDFTILGITARFARFFPRSGCRSIIAAFHVYQHEDLKGLEIWPKGHFGREVQARYLFFYLDISITLENNSSVRFLEKANVFKFFGGSY